MSRREHEATSLVDLAEINEIELLIMKRLGERTSGEHRSLHGGSGFDFVGLRDWTPGDRMGAIDWPQSTLTNFTPLVVREFEERSTARVVAVADASTSMRCGLDGVPLGGLVARAVATIGLSAVFFQDPVGLVVFDERLDQLAAVRPRTGKSQVVHCLEAYTDRRGAETLPAGRGPGATIAGFLRQTSLVAVISDFLFEGADDFIRELAFLQGVHDVFLVLIDSAPAFALPPLAAGWVGARDVETGRTRVLSRRTVAALPDRVRTWQEGIRRTARDAGLDVVQVGPDRFQADLALAALVAERRGRKV